ncbi:hypothetical protein MRX96_055422 [Rhipicephalus microplus]
MEAWGSRTILRRHLARAHTLLTSLINLETGSLVETLDGVLEVAKRFYENLYVEPTPPSADFLFVKNDQTSEPRNDTRIEVTSQASSLRNGGASDATSLSSGWDTAYKLLYETFSYPEAKELEALLPLPSTYLTRKQRRDRKGDHGEPRKKEQQRQHATRELTYRHVSPRSATLK